jgi:DNA-binding MarR family transcriptional regulator
LCFKNIVFPSGKLKMANLKLEIVQEVPFFNTEEEAFLGLLRTADCLHRAFHRKIRKWGITSTQYNVLRILRGTQPHGLTCSAIGSRMITAEPDITRLLARLKGLELIRQRYDQKDHRVIWTKISQAGLKLLQEMDPVIQAVPRELLKSLNCADLAELIRLLELARIPNEDLQTPANCAQSQNHSQQGCNSEQQKLSAPANSPD